MYLIVISTYNIHERTQNALDNKRDGTEINQCICPSLENSESNFLPNADFSTRLYINFISVSKGSEAAERLTLS